MTEEQELATKDLYRRRKRDYQLALNSPAIQAMLTDLAAFCKAVRLSDKPHIDDGEEMSPTRMAILVGRQQVWERIQHHFHLSADQLYALYTGRIIVVSGDDNAVA